MFEQYSIIWGIPSRNCNRSIVHPSRTDTEEFVSIDCVLRSRLPALRKQRNGKCISAFPVLRQASLELEPSSTTRMFCRFVMHSCKRCLDHTIMLAVLRIVGYMILEIPSLDYVHNRCHQRKAMSNRPIILCVLLHSVEFRWFDCVLLTKCHHSSPVKMNMLDQRLLWVRLNLDDHRILRIQTYENELSDSLVYVSFGSLAKLYYLDFQLNQFHHAAPVDLLALVNLVIQEILAHLGFLQKRFKFVKFSLCKNNKQNVKHCLILLQLLQ